MGDAFGKSGHTKSFCNRRGVSGVPTNTAVRFNNLRAVVLYRQKPQSSFIIKCMRKTLTAFVKLGIVAVLALGAVVQAQDKKVDPTGKWTWTTPGRNGGPDRKMTLTLKVDGEKLTGKLASPGREGQAVETEISDAKLKGEEVTFSVTREFNGNKMTSKYKGKVTADTIKGKIESERNGQPQSRDWEAKREVEKK